MSHPSGAVAVLEPAIDLEALAAIVRELLSGSSATLHHSQHLQARALAAGLDEDVRAALEALRRKLCQGAALLIDDGVASWN